MSAAPMAPPQIDISHFAIVDLPPFVTPAARVANDSSVATFAMPVSGLTFEPTVDVQARSFAEGQADIAVRGGIFENTGFRFGGVALVDPQTGHYGAELSVPPSMLVPVRVLTGADAAFSGFNASVATLAYDWAKISPRGEISYSLGDHDTWRSGMYQAVARSLKSGGQLAADVVHEEHAEPLAAPERPDDGQRDVRVVADADGKREGAQSVSGGESECAAGGVADGHADGDGAEAHEGGRENRGGIAHGGVAQHGLEHEGWIKDVHEQLEQSGFGGFG